MKYIAAYALLVLSGKDEPTEAEVAKLLKDTGVDADKDQLALLIKNLKGKKLHELIEAGSKKIATVAAAPAAAGAGAPVAAAEEKKEEPKEEPE